MDNYTSVEKFIDGNYSLFDTNWVRFHISSNHRTDVAKVVKFFLDERPELSPHPAFDPAFYVFQQNNLDLMGLSAIELFMHFLERGESLGLMPAPALNLDWYLRVNPDLRKAYTNGHLNSPFIHFITQGISESRQTDPFFNEVWYLSKVSSDNQKVPLNFLPPIMHYIQFGRYNNIDPSPWINESFCRFRFGSAIQEFPLTNYERYLNMGDRDRKGTSQFFDPKYYISKNPDAEVAIRNGEYVDALHHFLVHGLSRHAIGHPLGLDRLITVFTSSTYANLTFDERLRDVRPSQAELEKEYAWEEEIMISYSNGHKLSSGKLALLIVFPVLTVTAACVLLSYIRMFNYSDYRIEQISNWLENRLTETFSLFSHGLVGIDNFPNAKAFPGADYNIYISGFAFWPKSIVKELTLTCEGFADTKLFWVRYSRNDVNVFASSLGFLADEDLGFAAIGSLKVPAEAAGQTLKFRLQADLLFGDKTVSWLMMTREIEVNEKAINDITTQQSWSGHINDPKVAICMATYNPTREMLVRQIGSIIKQTHTNWNLYISDDNSSFDSFLEIKKFVQMDKRITLAKNGDNRGFVENFESSLLMVPANSDFVICCDQDDEWFPEKLSRLIGCFSDHTVVAAFSDMRIVDGKMRVISDTFWKNRKVHYNSPTALLVANTITGAACMFRQSLMEKIIPIPRANGLFHDQWIAFVASLVGTIAYYEKPLYDYVQHGSNVLGFSMSGSNSGSYNRMLYKSLMRYQKNDICLFDFIRSCAIDPTLVRSFMAFCAILRGLNNKMPEELFSLLSYTFIRNDNHQETNRRLLSQVFRNMSDELESLNIHLVIISGLYVLNNSLSFEERMCLLRGEIENQRNNALAATEAESYSDRIAAYKIRNISTKIGSSTKRRVNLIIPEMSSRVFFGGYMGKFGFAKQLIDHSIEVRIVVVDQPVRNVKEEINLRQQFSDVDYVMNHADIVYVGGRKKDIDISHSDVFIATTWWTAYLADDLRKRIGQSHFLYLIQEYEPFTYPLGTLYALAENTYKLSYKAIVSTDILLRFLVESKVGYPFSAGQSLQDTAVSFNNPVEAYSNTSEKGEQNAIKGTEVSKPIRTIIFYCRPQQHAARNMFEIGLEALREFVLSSDPLLLESCRFIGIGSDIESSIDLGKGCSLKVLSKLPLNEYRRILSSGDIGVALMYTPHPSLLPIEMAMNGLEVVTNTCMTKGKDAFAFVSDAIHVANPTAKDISSEIKSAMLTKERRKFPAHVRWPTSFESSFADGRIEKIICWINDLVAH